MHTYESATGRWLHNNSFLWVGYSGHELGVNNPALEREHDVGPIPRGQYVIGHPFTHSKLGAYVMALTPKSGTQTFGRSGFFLHGDFGGDVNKEASHGCIIKSPLAERQLVGESGDFDLTVV